MTGDASGGAPPRRPRVAVVAARFNEMVVQRLVDGARAALRNRGVADVDVFWVPGAFELPVVAERAARTERYRAIVCLGAVIRGETSHFEYVATEAARGIREAGMRTGVPITFGVLTTDTLEQALDRAGGAHGNKGWDAAEAAWELASVLAQIDADC